jgi:hypothetical protein
MWHLLAAAGSAGCLHLLPLELVVVVLVALGLQPCMALCQVNYRVMGFVDSLR